jgi:hypothetical protein
MRRGYSLIVFVFILFYACTSRNKIPSDIIPPDVMSDVFFDISMAEGFVENFHSKDSSWVKDSILISEVDKLLAMRKLSQAQFRASYDFYKLHPPLFKKVVDTAYDRAQRNRDKMFKRPVVQ